MKNSDPRNVFAIQQADRLIDEFERTPDPQRRHDVAVKLIVGAMVFESEVTKRKGGKK